jgi:hypothetical protein
MDAQTCCCSMGFVAELVEDTNTSILCAEVDGGIAKAIKLLVAVLSSLVRRLVA